jgi:hypothetical protein
MAEMSKVRLQNHDGAGFITLEDGEKGMAEVSKVYGATGRVLYMGLGVGCRLQE